jgi:hypothetical protein
MDWWSILACTENNLQSQSSFLPVLWGVLLSPLWVMLGLCGPMWPLPSWGPTLQPQPPLPPLPAFASTAILLRPVNDQTVASMPHSEHSPYHHCIPVTLTFQEALIQDPSLSTSESEHHLYIFLLFLLFIFGKRPDILNISYGCKGW